MTATAISQGHNEARLGGTLAYLDAGPDKAFVRIYGGTRPAAGESPGTPLLVQIELNDPSGTVTNNSLVLSSIDLATVGNSGTATWARIINGNGAWVIDCDAGAQGSGAPVILSSTTLYAGGKVGLLSGVFY